jgi:hypothetical protein
MGSHLPSAAELFHAVKFYDTPASISRAVADFIADGWMHGQPALIIATPAHRDGILARLEAMHIDTRVAQVSSDLLTLDAEETLAALMVDGMPDARRFIDIATRALAAVGGGRQQGPIRAYGEMVDVLWKQGQEAAAIRLEMLWNRLATTHRFSLLCGYAKDSTYRDAARAAIRHQHTHVLGESGTLAPAIRPTQS